MHNSQRQDWFVEWFASPYYRLLYSNRDQNEAALLIENLIKKLSGPVAESEISSVLSELRKHNAMNQAREYLQSLAKEANEILMKLPDIPARSALIKLTSLLVERSR